jgi:hypothetical protein
MLDPFVQAVLANTDPGGNLGHLMASHRDLLYRFDFELVGIRLFACHSTSYWCLRFEA